MGREPRISKDAAGVLINCGGSFYRQRDCYIKADLMRMGFTNASISRYLICSGHISGKMYFPKRIIDALVATRDFQEWRRRGEQKRIRLSRIKIESYRTSAYNNSTPTRSYSAQSAFLNPKANIHSQIDIERDNSLVHYAQDESISDDSATPKHKTEHSCIEIPNTTVPDIQTPAHITNVSNDADDINSLIKALASSCLQLAK